MIVYFHRLEPYSPIIFEIPRRYAQIKRNLRHVEHKRVLALEPSLCSLQPSPQNFTTQSHQSSSRYLYSRQTGTSFGSEA